MNYQELTPADKGMLAATIDNMAGQSDDVIADELVSTIVFEHMCHEDDALDLAYDTITNHFN